MEFKQIKYDFLRHTKEFCFSENYSVFCTGRRAFICDGKLNLLHTAEKLSYAYYPYISPDEKKILIVSTINVFYLVDLDDFKLKKYTVCGKYRDNLEGRGCWSFDGRSLYFNVCNPQTFDSALRRYDLDNNMEHTDLIEEKYWLVSIKPVKELNKYLLIGMDRKKAELDRIDCYSMIWFDGTSFEEYPIWNIDVCDDGIQTAEYENQSGTVILYGFDKTFRCDLYGKIIKDMSLSYPEKITASFSNVFENVGLDNADYDKITKLCASLGLENVSIDDSIHNICLSADGKKYYVGTHLGIYVLDAETQNVISEKKIDYGVQKITEVSPNVIFVSTCSGVKVFEIVE